MYGISRLKKLMMEEKFILKTINECKLIFPIYYPHEGRSMRLLIEVSMGRVYLPGAAMIADEKAARDELSN